MGIYQDDSVVAEITAGVMARGHSIFQIFKFGNDERHVHTLLSLFSPPPGRMLDAGCGVGAVSALMKAERPDIECVLLNISRAQLDLCPDMEKIHSDFHSVPVADASFDSAMMNYSLGHGRLNDAMAEMSRVLRPGGVLFIYDLACDDQDQILDALDYRAFRETDVIASAEASGLRCTMAGEVEARAGAFMNVMDQETFFSLFHGMRPVAYRFVKADA